MKINFPNDLPFIGAFFGLAAGAAYYLSIMLSQFFIGRPSSTWILGVFWLPILLLKPCLVGLLIGIVLRCVLMGFYDPQELTAHGMKILKVSFVVLMVISIAAGTWKIYKMNESGELKHNKTSYNTKQQGLTPPSTQTRLITGLILAKLIARAG